MVRPTTIPQQQPQINMNLIQALVLILTVMMAIKQIFDRGREKDLPYAFAASIRVDGKVECVGAILTSTWYLAICNCVRGAINDPSRVTVRVGVLVNNARILAARKILCNPKFRSLKTSSEYNLGLILISVPWSSTAQKLYGRSVKKVMLPMHNQSTAKEAKIIKRPRFTSSFIQVTWSYNKLYASPKTDLGWHISIRAGIFGYQTGCVNFTNVPSSKLMHCAEFVDSSGAASCTSEMGSLMVQNSMLWGLMGFRSDNCRKKSKFFVPFVDVAQQENLGFILRTVGKIKGKMKYTYLKN